jgi:transposase
MWRVVECIIYKLKTGVQWSLLPLKEFFRKPSISWQSIFYRYNTWCADGSWEQVWNHIFGKYKSELNLSSIELDGTHSPCKSSGEQIGYQGRKKAKTTNMLLISDLEGNVIGSSEPISGEHHDSFEIKKVLTKIFESMQAKGLNLDGLFLNADPGFDSKELRELCEQYGVFPNIKANKRNAPIDSNEGYLFDNELYKDRYVIERTNAWIDNFRQLTIRYETKARNWLGAHFLAFTLIFLKNRKIVNFYF